MLVEAGCRAVIIAHSERRQFFGETDETANRKVKAALAAGLTPILCVGETLARTRGRRYAEGAGPAVSGLAGRVDHLRSSHVSSWLTNRFGPLARAARPLPKWQPRRTNSCAIWRLVRSAPKPAASLRILYGGSVKPDNVKGLMAQADIDGALVGGRKPGCEAVCGDCELLEAFQGSFQGWSSRCQKK